MLSFFFSRASAEADSTFESPPDSFNLPFRDRTTPMWASVVSALFSIGGGICLLAISLFSVFFFDQVALKHQDLLALLLVCCAIVPILGVVVFEVGHARALAGYRYMRLRHRAVGRAAAAMLAGCIFGFLDPLLAVPFVVGAILSWLLYQKVARWIRLEPMWEFLPQEAISFLTGRDQRAVELANAPRIASTLLDALHTALTLFGFVFSFAMATWLVSQGKINIAAIAMISLVTTWSIDAFASFFRQLSQIDPERQRRALKAIQLEGPNGADVEPHGGALVVHGLTVKTPKGRRLLSDVSFRAEPGSVIGISGDSLAGKSLLLRSIQAPFDLDGLELEGFVSLDGVSLWERSGEDRLLPSCLFPPEPLTVPGSGQNNLGCFLGTPHLERTLRVLQSLVFTVDTVERIQKAKDVRMLSVTERKALSFARALALKPKLYLFDRPEDGASESLLGALADRLRGEARLGHIILLATENRRLLELCDKMIIMQNGRIIEFAERADIQARQSSGWSRFATSRDLENEEALDAWICSQFRRDGDEANRRAVCMIANEMLSVACQAQFGGGDNDIAFEFKHFSGKCLLLLVDEHLTLSSGALKKARVAAETTVAGVRLSPLAKVIRDSLDVQVIQQDDIPALQATIKTYDPRLHKGEKVAKNASTKS